MIKSLFQYERKKLLKLLYVHLAFTSLYCLFWGVIIFCSYQGGYTATQDSSYFGIRLLFMLLSPLIFFPCLIVYIILILWIGLKYIFPSTAITMVLLVILTFAISQIYQMVSPEKGYYNYIKDNVDIVEIHDWLEKYEDPDYTFTEEDGTKSGSVLDWDWPQCIKNLNPTRGVLIGEIETIKYIRIMYAVDWELSIGLCVMEKPMEVPEYGFDVPEKRIMLSENAFVFSVD